MVFAISLAEKEILPIFIIIKAHNNLLILNVASSKDAGIYIFKMSFILSILNNLNKFILP